MAGTTLQKTLAKQNAGTKTDIKILEVSYHG
jgi:hypothetical protein